jgi:hypothetical protein
MYTRPLRARRIQNAIIELFGRTKFSDYHLLIIDHLIFIGLNIQTMLIGYYVRRAAAEGNDDFHTFMINLAETIYIFHFYC